MEGKRAKGSPKRRLEMGQQQQRTNDNMFASIVSALTIGITTSTVTKSMNVAKRMHSSVQNAVESFHTSRIAFTTSSENTKLCMRRLTST